MSRQLLRPRLTCVFQKPGTHSPPPEPAAAPPRPDAGPGLGPPSLSPHRPPAPHPPPPAATGFERPQPLLVQKAAGTGRAPPPAEPRTRRLDGGPPSPALPRVCFWFLFQTDIGKGNTATFSAARFGLTDGRRPGDLREPCLVLRPGRGGPRVRGPPDHVIRRPPSSGRPPAWPGGRRTTLVTLCDGSIVLFVGKVRFGFFIYIYNGHILFIGW